jgi:serine/threonine protein kinase
VIDTIGFNTYGCTLQVKSESNIEFAMRVIDKSKAIDEEMEEEVNNLRKVGGKLTHPLIAKQYRIFSDEFRIYFMNRWVEG